jgi:hypothetical protein
VTDAEWPSWERMSRADRVESIWVGRRAQRMLTVPDGPWIAAALLHDVGKTDAHLGTFGRSAATAIATVVGHARARRWAGTPGWRGRVGRYVGHDDAGAALLQAAGARAEVVAWAAVHHRPADWAEWSIPPDVGRALAEADGEKADVRSISR